VQKFLLACASSLLILSQTGCSATDKAPLDSTSKPQTQMLKSGATLNDVLSTKAVGESYFEGKETVAVILLGNRIIFELQDGKALEISYSEPNHHQSVLSNQNIVNGFGTGMWVLSNMFTHLKKQKEIVGQANLSLLVKEDHTCEILSKALYVPDCKPYTGGAEIPPGVQEFWQQIKSAVDAVESRHLNLPGPHVKSETFEIVIGRDPSMFPRYATPFNGMLKRDKNGKIEHVNAFVRDGAD
jgi:hypothetical protein